MTRSRLGAFGLLLAAFVLGGIVGGVGMTRADSRDEVRPRPGQGGTAFLTRLTDTLTLSPAQQDSIHAILERHDPVADSLWREVRPRFDSLRTALQDDIRAQLTDDQQRKYNEMLERRDREYRQRRANEKR